MEILSGETGFFLLVDLRNELNWFNRDFLFDKKKNTRWQEIAGDMLEQKLKDITLNFPVPYEKDTTSKSDSKQRMSW